MTVESTTTTTISYQEALTTMFNHDKINCTYARIAFNAGVKQYMSPHYPIGYALIADTHHHTHVNYVLYILHTLLLYCAHTQTLSDMSIQIIVHCTVSVPNTLYMCI